MFYNSYTPISAKISSFRSITNHSARETLDGLGLPLLFETGLVTKSYKSKLLIVSPVDRHRSISKVLSLVTNYITKTVPYLTSEVFKRQLRTNDGNPPAVPQYTAGLFLSTASRTRSVRIPLFPVGQFVANDLPPQIATLRARKIELINRYVSRVIRNFVQKYDLSQDRIRVDVTTFVNPEIVVGTHSLTPEDSIHSRYIGLFLEIVNDDAEAFCIVVMWLRELKGFIKMLKTLARIRASEGLEDVGLFGRRT